MGYLTHKMAIGGIALSQVFSSALADDSPSDIANSLILQSDQECVSYDPYRQNCTNPGLNIEFESRKNIWNFQFEGSYANDEYHPTHT